MAISEKEKYTILWADDDQDDMALVHEVLESAYSNFTIAEVRNGQEVLNYLNERSPEQYPCLIILDINMPKLNGKETLARLKADERYKHISIVMFSTSSHPVDKEFSQKYGVEMVKKPSTYPELKQMIEHLLTYCTFYVYLKTFPKD